MIERRAASHDAYGKRVVRAAAGAAFDDSREACWVDYGGASHTGGFIDGAVAGSIAVEIESRVSKQVRGAVLDLLMHRLPKKLLVLLDVHQNNVNLTAEQCRFALARFLTVDSYAVIILRGSGSLEDAESDAEIVRNALARFQ
jgi:hypothetical protein